MMNSRVLPCRKFYTIRIVDHTEFKSNSCTNEIAKIIHVEIQKKGSNGDMLCRIETFRREHDNNAMPQSEKELWRQLALITDDLAFIINADGQPTRIVNWEIIKKKGFESCQSIRQTYKGVLIENLLNQVEAIYIDPDPLLKSFHQYNQNGLLTLGLFLNDNDMYERGNILHLDEDPFQITIRECFTKKGESDDQIHFAMEGFHQNSQTDIPFFDAYGGEFAFDIPSGIIRKASVEIIFSKSNCIKKRTYCLQALSENDLHFI